MSLIKVALSKIVNTQRPKTVAEDEVWLLNLDQIESDSGRILNFEKVNFADIGSSTVYFERGTVLYSKLRPYLNKVVIADRNGYATSELVPLRCNPEVVYPNYLAYFLRSEIFLNFASNVVAGAKMPRMVMAEFWKYEISLPPLSEQKRITEILDKADDLRHKRQQSIAKLDELLQATFIDMFGDPVTNPKGWETKKLKAISSFENGDRSKNYPSGNDLVTAGIPFLSTKNIKNFIYDESSLNFITQEKFNQLTRGKAKNGDILITLRGTLGSTCIFTSQYETGFINAQMMIIKANSEIVFSEFLHQILSFSSMQEFLQNLGQGAAVPQLTAKQLENLNIIIPPDDLQLKWKKFSKQIQTQKNFLTQQLTQQNQLFQSLQQQAFSGTL